MMPQRSQKNKRFTPTPISGVLKMVGKTAPRNIQKPRLVSGFSLVEFTVVLTIVGIMAGVATFNYNGYRRTIEQTNVAQDIALSIRQAQLYGISAGDGIIGDSDFIDDAQNNFSSVEDTLDDIVSDRSIRGVSINKDDNTITIFEDLDRDNAYDDTVDRVVDKRSILSNDVSIGDFCLGGSIGSCTATETVGLVNITFERPYSDAIIYYDDPNNATPPQAYTYVAFEVDATDRDDTHVEITAIGKISVK